VVCVASYFKGVEFMRECRRQGARVFLITREKALDEDWPRDCLEDILALPDDASEDLFKHAVVHLARRHPVDRLVALEEFDVLATAGAREHLQLPGTTTSAARLFRDKLAMRVRASACRIRVPEFVHVLNHEAVAEFMSRVPPPWVLKPRSDVNAVGIKKLDDAEEVWRAVEALDARESLAEQSSYFLLERYIPGEVFHVDSLSEGGAVVFDGASRYGRPPMDVAHKGGIFTSHTVEYDSKEHEELTRLNRKLLRGLGLSHGAAHAEFIRSAEDGRLYFLEVAARVGGAYIAETLEAATGINLWREWARIELSGGRRADDERTVPRREYGGIALSLARQAEPDTSTYTEPEIVYRIKKPHHVGLVVRAPELARVRELLDDYARRFGEDFLAVAPPLERVPR
jgi:biotin carboxylase